MTTKHSRPFVITVLVLVFLVAISSVIVVGTYAKYVASDSVSDSARTAVFNVNGSGDMFTTSYALEVDPVQEDTIDNALTVKNKSEVAVRCTLTLNSTAGLPLRFTWTDSEGNELGTVAAGDEISFDMPPNEDEDNTYSLTVSWDGTEDENKLFTYRRQVDSITLSAVCAQID